MKKKIVDDFIGDNLIYRSIAVYVLLLCFFQLVTGYFLNWEMFAYVI